MCSNEVGLFYLLECSTLIAYDFLSERSSINIHTLNFCIA
jgi:hypothetical protein